MSSYDDRADDLQLAFDASGVAAQLALAHFEGGVSVTLKADGAPGHQRGARRLAVPPRSCPLSHNPLQLRLRRPGEGWAGGPSRRDAQRPSGGRRSRRSFSGGGERMSRPGTGQP